MPSDFHSIWRSSVLKPRQSTPRKMPSVSSTDKSNGIVSTSLALMPRFTAASSFFVSKRLKMLLTAEAFVSFSPDAETVSGKFS
jgi:hypothetical protein